MKDFLLPLVAAGAGSVPSYGLNTPCALAAGSWSAFRCAAAAACGGVFGGRSSPPLRPQPTSASTAALKRMMVHP